MATPIRAANHNGAAAPPTRVSFFKLFCYADKYDYGLMALGTLGAIGNGLCLPAFYYIFAKILHSFGESPNNPQKTAHDVAKYSVDLVYLGLVNFVCASAGQRQASKWRPKYLQAILSQDVSFSDTDSPTGTLVESISNRMLLVQDAISEKMGIFAHFMAACIGGFGVAFLIMWKIGLASLAFIPAYVVAHIFNVHLLNNQTYKGGTWSIVEQTIEHIRTIYSFTYEGRAAQYFSDSINLNLKYALAKGLGWGIVIAMTFFTNAFFLWYGGVLVRNSETTGGKVLGAIMSAYDGASYLLYAMTITTAFSKGREAVFNIIEVMNKPANTSDKLDLRPSEVKGDLELQNVAFSYASAPDDMILRDLSFSIPAGRTVALVGACGSGKTTVLSLIERFYKPKRGLILLDGVDIHCLHLGWFRDQISLVNQELLLFETSILNNILCGKQDATMQEVEAAAKAANAHTFIIKLPNAYETQVGSWDVQLSDGQKQRLIIARAMLKNPKVLLLDEPTRGLNVASEKKVQDALGRLMVERSTLIIAHRLSSIQNADTINVLQDGRVVEMGFHNQLIRERELGPYSVLVKLQQLALGGDGTVLGRTSKSASCRNNLKKNRRRDSVKPMRHHASNDSIVCEETDEEDVAVVNAETTVLERSSKQSFWRLLNMSAPLWPCICLGSIGAVLTGTLFNPIFGFMLGEMLQVFYESDTPDIMKRDVQKYALVLVAVGIVAIGIQMVQYYYFGVVAEVLAARVKEMVFKEMLKKEVGWFDLAENSSKRLKEELVTVADSLHTLFTIGLVQILKCAACFVTAFTVGFILEWRLALIMLATFPLLVGSTIGQELCIDGLKVLVNRAYAHSNTAVEVSISNIRTITASNAKEKIVFFSEEALREPVKRALFRGNISSILLGVSRMTLYCTYGLILWYGSILATNGTSNFGSTIKVFMVISVAACEVGSSFRPILWTINAFKALDSILGIIDHQTSINPDDPSSEVVKSISGNIELVDVEFAYPTRPDVIVFKGLNLNVKAGQKIALVGAKGCGKSSVIALVERFYDPTKGRVMIDGKDIRGLNLQSLRQHIGLVQSDPVLFKTSIKENILYGWQEADEAEVQAAAEAANQPEAAERAKQDKVQAAADAAQAHIFIHELRGGYMAMVDEPGVVLSRGQRQRVAIARVVLKKPAILLLDDATAGLDPAQEKVVQTALEDMMTGRTTIMVTHNLTDLWYQVDCICVLESGRIVEQGTHGQLMEANGSYARLFNIQRALTPPQKQRPPV